MLRRAYIAPFALALLVVMSAGTVAMDRDLEAGAPAVDAPVVRVVAAPLVTPSPEPDPTPSPLPARPVPTSSPRPPRPAREPAPPAFPLRGAVRIPSLGIDGPVVATGLDQTQNMSIPRNSRDVAWLDYGSYPGPYRNAILAGHRSWGGRQGTLWKLDQVTEGAEVLVDVDGVTHAYIVRWVRLYDPDEAPVDELLGDTEVHSLTLITCGGRFDRGRGGYEMRVVVRAEFVEAQAGAG